MTNVREKGHRYERQVINEINDLDKDYKVGSSRLLSTYMDGKMVDIVDYPDCAKKFPFHIQCKSVSKTISYNDLFENFEVHDKPFVIFHNFTKKSGSRFYKVEEYVILKKKDFYDLIKEK